MQLKETPSPSDRIVLLDGRELTAYPCMLKEPSIVNRRVPSVEEFLALEAQQSKDVKLAAKEEAKAQIRLFIENAFFLYEHREHVFSDSRMFLSPVAVQNGLAYTGTSGFTNPTLGVYLEWWVNCEGALRVDDNGVRSLVYYLAGSPLSGANSCAAVFEDGKSEKVSLRPFCEYWRSFMHINKRYDNAKSCYEAYTLQQVLDLLKKD